MGELDNTCMKTLTIEQGNQKPNWCV